MHEREHSPTQFGLPGASSVVSFDVMRYEPPMPTTKQASHTAKPSPDHMLVLERGLAVIECFDGQAALSLTDLARLTAVSRPPASPCLPTPAPLHHPPSAEPPFR